MSFESLPWPEMLLGLGAALSILVLYDVAYVWPLCRRHRALEQRCKTLERALGDLAVLSARVAELDSRGREDLARLGERLGQLELATDARAYEQAIDFASRGENAERLISCLGLTEGEANLVRLLHGRTDAEPGRVTLA
jgi:hypothetical protein